MFFMFYIYSLKKPDNNFHADKYTRRPIIKTILAAPLKTIARNTRINNTINFLFILLKMSNTPLLLLVSIF